jgi:hypothetical protein
MSTGAIARYLAAEDNDFADLRGKLHWRSIDLKRLPNGDVTGTVFSDSSQLHEVYVDIFSDPQSGYRVDTTFAEMSALRS